MKFNLKKAPVRGENLQCDWDFLKVLINKKQNKKTDH